MLEALRDHTLNIRKVHLAESNKPAKIIDQIVAAAEQRQLPVEYKSKLELSRISKSSKQDQGVAADIQLASMFDLSELEQLVENSAHKCKLIMLDGVTNPQNVGMIIRSVAASGIDGIIIPRKGCADLGPLTIKASAGAVFHCPIYRCHTVNDALQTIKELDGQLLALALDAKARLGEESQSDKLNVYVLGNESEGVSRQTMNACQEKIVIPMHNNVESLNVAVTAALIAFSQ